MSSTQSLTSQRRHRNDPIADVAPGQNARRISNAFPGEQSGVPIDAVKAPPLNTRHPLLYAIRTN